MAEIIEILNDEKSEDDMLEETVTEEPILKLVSISKILNFIQKAIEESINFDPILTRSLKFKNNCEIAMKCYEELYKDMARRAKQ